MGFLAAIAPDQIDVKLKEIFGALGRTVVLVTHDLAEAGYLADRLVLLAAGEIVQAGTLDDLRERPASDFVTEFLSAQRPPVEI